MQYQQVLSIDIPVQDNRPPSRFPVCSSLSERGTFSELLPFIVHCGSLVITASLKVTFTRSELWEGDLLPGFPMKEKSKMPHRKLSSLADLGQLLTDSERKQLPPEVKKREHDGKSKTVRVRLDTKGRKGKSVTLVEGLQHNPATMAEIARILKQHCGAGGTVKGGQIEIHGDQRGRVSDKLREMNYVIK